MVLMMLANIFQTLDTLHIEEQHNLLTTVTEQKLIQLEDLVDQMGELIGMLEKEDSNKNQNYGNENCSSSKTLADDSTNREEEALGRRSKEITADISIAQLDVFKERTGSEILLEKNRAINEKKDAFESAENLGIEYEKIENECINEQLATGNKSECVNKEKHVDSIMLEEIYPKTVSITGFDMHERLEEDIVSENSNLKPSDENATEIQDNYIASDDLEAENINITVPEKNIKENINDDTGSLHKNIVNQIVEESVNSIDYSNTELLTEDDNTITRNHEQLGRSKMPAEENEDESLLMSDVSINETIPENEDVNINGICSNQNTADKNENNNHENLDIVRNALNEIKDIIINIGEAVDKDIKTEKNKDKAYKRCVTNIEECLEEHEVDKSVNKIKNDNKSNGFKICGNTNSADFKEDDSVNVREDSNKDTIVEHSEAGTSKHDKMEKDRYVLEKNNDNPLLENNKLKSYTDNIFNYNKTLEKECDTEAINCENKGGNANPTDKYIEERIIIERNVNDDLETKGNNAVNVSKEEFTKSKTGNYEPGDVSCESLCSNQTKVEENEAADSNLEKFDNNEMTEEELKYSSFDLDDYSYIDFLSNDDESITGICDSNVNEIIQKFDESEAVNCEESNSNKTKKDKDQLESEPKKIIDVEKINRKPSVAGNETSDFTADIDSIEKIKDAAAKFTNKTKSKKERKLLSINPRPLQAKLVHIKYKEQIEAKRFETYSGLTTTNNGGFVINNGVVSSNKPVDITKFKQVLANKKGITVGKEGEYTNNLGGPVINNSGVCHNNSGFVENRKGGYVENSNGTVENFDDSTVKNFSGGTVYNNDDGVVHNYADGVVINFTGLVYNHSGTVHNYFGIVRNINGTVIHQDGTKTTAKGWFKGQQSKN